ncbi:MAG TPA: HAMP domain-containing sensor histidine kinase [Kofleriaceae bacterium]|nr:HAMP domain-containing sensor histidine kinase [Kofleriaceae bacterium]
MSIRFRFTLALTVVGVVLFGLYGLLAYRSEREDLRAAATREIGIIGRSLEVSLGNALRDRQRADIEEMLTILEAFAPNMDIHVFDPGGHPIARSHGAAGDDELERFAARSIAARGELIAFDPPDEPARLVFVAPLTADDGAALGSVAISRPVDDLAAALARTRERLLVTVVGFLLATMAAGLALGTLLVTRPIARLLDGMRHVREGDFRARVRPGHHDEIGRLVDEFNAMIGALAEERSRAEAEAEARARLERGLQRVDKLVTIGQLSAGLAHEIGSPLQVLSGRATALAAHADPEVRRQAEQLVTQCDRITRVVEQLLSFGRRKAAAVALCDLVEPVRVVIDLLAGEARRRGIALAMDVGDRPYQIEGDRDQIQQVTLNLVKNALAATPSGGTIAVRIDRAGELVRLCVRDSGAGIGPEIQARLFEPFFTTRASEGGTGLGLAVVRAIADEHRARIEVHSQPGRGAEFVVSFPARPEVRYG